MAHPGRNSSSENIASPVRTFFATTRTNMSRRLLQSQRNADLLIDVLRSLVREQKFKLEDFVIMPDHVHLLITLEKSVTIEKAMQLIKGRFSHRLSKEFNFLGEVWQRGYSEVQILNKESFEQRRNYIANNPIKAGLASARGLYPFCFESLARTKAESQQRHSKT